MKKKIKYTDEPMENVRIIPDFLPSPENLELKMDLSEIPELDEEWFKKAKIRIPTAKPLISIRLDSDVLEWFKSHGEGYQTRINAVLRMYMKAHSRTA